MWSGNIREEGGFVSLVAFGAGGEVKRVKLGEGISIVSFKSGVNSPLSLEVFLCN